ncbi:MAG TPA: GDSL-type esterase/lipase family protein [Actinoplanes sp.]|nr:GDSL-type esterase/lipase family protein [Actinoplanes sp.]
MKFHRNNIQRCWPINIYLIYLHAAAIEAGGKYPGGTVPESSRMPTTCRISANDHRLRYRGAISLQELPDGIAPWRVPHREARLFLPQGGIGRAAMPAGVRVTFRTDSRSVGCAYRAQPPPELPSPPPEVATMDVRVDGELVSTTELRVDGGAAETTVRDLPPGEHLIEIWLPFFSQIVVSGILLDEGASLTRDEGEAPRWTHFGSSISQGRGAVSPSRTWAALTSRDAGLDLTLTAMGGGCQIQPMFGRLIRDLPADVITLCLGINPHYFSSLNAETYQPNLIGFLRLIRERHPATPIAVISSIYSPLRENRPNDVKLTLADYRVHTADAVHLLCENGDQMLTYVNGLDLFGPADAEHMLERIEADPVHLGPSGHILFAHRFHRLLDLLTKADALPADLSPALSSPPVTPATAAPVSSPRQGAARSARNS